MDSRAVAHHHRLDRNRGLHTLRRREPVPDALRSTGSVLAGSPVSRSSDPHLFAMEHRPPLEQDGQAQAVARKSRRYFPYRAPSLRVAVRRDLIQLCRRVRLCVFVSVGGMASGSDL